MTEIERTRQAATDLHTKLLALIEEIGPIHIGEKHHFPFGGRKAAKGRTVWRLLEEAISQNLELNAEQLGLSHYAPASSEVGVYDFKYRADNHVDVYVNVKSSVSGGRTNKDDISKALSLRDFVRSHAPCCLLVATVEIEFSEDPMSLVLSDCHVVPLLWLPDIYVNPSNNGNLQSSKYKYIDLATPRTTEEFLPVLDAAMEAAATKRRNTRNS